MIGNDKQWRMVGVLFVVGAVVSVLLAATAVLGLAYLLARGVASLL